MKNAKTRSLLVMGSLLIMTLSTQKAASQWAGLRRRKPTIQKTIRKPTRPTGAQRISTARDILKTGTPAQKRALLAGAKATVPTRSIDKRAQVKTMRERMAQIRQRLKKRAQKEPAPFVGLDTVDVAIADIEEIPEDHFTQSEAQLNEKSVRYLIEQNYPKLAMYLNIISQAISKEQEHKNTHYAFYHALDNVWIATQDVYKALHAYLFPMTTGIEDFRFLRWGSFGYEGTAQEFLIDQLKNDGLVDDNKDSVKAFLLSVNLALFGNVGYPGECTWQYFIRPTSHAQPNEAIFKSILDVFGIDHKYIPELMKLSDLITTKEQTLLQIFIPIDQVDEIAYISLVRGIPAHDETINWVLKNIKSKRYTDVKPVLDKLTDIYKTEGARNPTFKELLEQAEKGDFSVHNLLKIYRNTPWKIPNLNYLQARLILTQDVLLNPDSGVKFFRYSTITRKQKRAYDKAFDELINKIVEEFLAEQEEALEGKPTTPEGS